jgi:hypothetical protein
MSGWLLFLLIWMGSIPTWAMLYGAYRFRRFRDLSRYFLLRGLMFLALFGALAVSSVSPSISREVGMPGAVILLFFAGLLLTRSMQRKALKRIAENPEEAKRFEEAADPFK